MSRFLQQERQREKSSTPARKASYARKAPFVPFVRRPMSFVDLAKQILSDMRSEQAALQREAQEDPIIAMILRAFPGAWVMVESQPEQWPPPGSWRIERRQHWELPESELGPCYACGQRVWERGDGVWVCRLCHPDPHQIRAREGDRLSDNRAALLDLARDRGWSPVELRPGHSVVGSERGWLTFARVASEEDLAAARDALKLTESPVARG